MKTTEEKGDTLSGDNQEPEPSGRRIFVTTQHETREYKPEPEPCKTCDGSECIPSEGPPGKKEEGWTVDCPDCTGKEGGGG